MHRRIYFSRRSDQAAHSFLQADLIEKLTACVSEANTKRKLNYSTYQTKFDSNVTKMKWNYTANMIMNVSGTVCYLILYFPINLGLAINLQCPALKNKQRMCFELFEVFLTSSVDYLFLFLLRLLFLNRNEIIQRIRLWMYQEQYVNVFINFPVSSG